MTVQIFLPAFFLIDKLPQSGSIRRVCTRLPGRTRKTKTPESQAFRGSCSNTAGKTGGAVNCSASGFTAERLFFRQAANRRFQPPGKRASAGLKIKERRFFSISGKAYCKQQRNVGSSSPRRSKSNPDCKRPSRRRLRFLPCKINKKTFYLLLNPKSDILYTWKVERK